MDPERFNRDERTHEKQVSRAADARALASGAKTREELERDNGHFAFPDVFIDLRGTKPLE